jgi:type IV secretory pathway VirB3-like protein
MSKSPKWHQNWPELGSLFICPCCPLPDLTPFDRVCQIFTICKDLQKFPSSLVLCFLAVIYWSILIKFLLSTSNLMYKTLMVPFVWSRFFTSFNSENFIRVLRKWMSRYWLCQVTRRNNAFFSPCLRAFLKPYLKLLFTIPYFILKLQ